uniref:Uncharacterized protein n=1 Tax=Biomphalaria glabrata TaxID=6526 RepID=A0A2C9K639_BIOGL
MSELLPSGYKEPFYKGEYSFNTGRVHQFTWVDYLIFAAMLAISASIGVFHAIKDRKKNLDNYLMAGRQMSPIPVGLSLLASFMSAITLLGNPAEIYLYSIMYFWIGVGYFLCIAGASHIYLPMFYQLQVTSAYEVSEVTWECRLVLHIARHVKLIKMYGPHKNFLSPEGPQPTSFM